MRTIKAWNGIEVNLSDEVYKITGHDYLPPPNNYEVGTLVRLISGVDGSDVPGYHFICTYATVCRLDTEVAEFIGIPCKCLELQNVS